ncbi:MAG: amidohydrolase family protein, partial [Eubacteriales bacterium]
MAKLYYNGTILTMEGENKTAEAVLVEDGQIIAVGTLAEVKDVSSENVEQINLEGKTLMPSFIDPHGHVSMVAQMSSAADLSECDTFEEIVETLKAHQEKYQITADSLIMGFGYDHNFLPEEKHPTKEFLNQVSEEVPIFVLHTSGHMGCANDALLSLINVTEDTPNPQGGVIGRVEGTMEPNGYLEEGGMMAAYAVLGARIKFDLMTAMTQAQEMYLSNGVTTVQDGAAGKDTVKMMTAMSMMKQLKLDVVSYVMMADDTDEIMTENKDFVKQYVNGFKIGGYKV